jgi:hypothetical protein
VWSRIVDRIDGIDSGTKKNVRKATAGLMIIDPEQYKMSAESMLAIRDANQPLIDAACDNHYTRELDIDADAYINDKTYDIFRAMRFWKEQFPELTEKRSEAHACYWFKKILLPNVRRACAEKIMYYKEQMRDKNVSKNIKTILDECLTKNERYIVKIDQMFERPDIAEKSSIFNKVP